MPRGKGIYDDEDADEPKGEPTDQTVEEGGHSRRHRNRPGADGVSGHCGVSAFPAEPIGRAAKIVEPVGNQLDLRVAVHSGIERDVVVAGIDVAKGQARQRQEATRACGLLDVEFHSP